MNSSALSFPNSNAPSRCCLRGGPWRREGDKASLFVLLSNDVVTRSVRYRIYDFCFDIEYDEEVSPLIMQHIRAYNLPQHPLFNAEAWRKTAVFRPWRHKPRGLALMHVCKSIGWEAYFRFYWFHFPNFVLPSGGLASLQSRLRKIPRPHVFHVNALVKHHRAEPVGNIYDLDASTLATPDWNSFLSSLGLGSQDAPWMEFKTFSNRRERLILGTGLQIMQSISKDGEPENLLLCGKLGNLEFDHTVADGIGRLDFTDECYLILRQQFQQSRERLPRYIENAVRHVSNSIKQLSARNAQRPALPLVNGPSEAQGNCTLPTPPYSPTTSPGTSSRSEESMHIHNAIKHASNAMTILSGLTRHDSTSSQSGYLAARGHPSPESSTSAAKQDNRQSQLTTPDLQKTGNQPTVKPHYDNRKGTRGTGPTGGLRGGGGLRASNHDTIEFISRLLQDAPTGVRRPEEDNGLLRPVELRRFTSGRKPKSAEDAPKNPSVDLGQREMSCKPFICEISEEDGSTRSNGNEFVPKNGPVHPHKHNGDAKEAFESLRKQFDHMDETHLGAPGHTLRPARPRTSGVALDQALTEWSNLRSKSTASIATGHSRETSFEYRISQWIKREKEPDTSRRSSNSWTDREEARDLSSHKRVTSSSYHTCPSGRSSHRRSSSGTLCSTAPSRSSVKCQSDEPAPLPSASITTVSTAEPPRPQKRDDTSSASEATSSNTPNPAPELASALLDPAYPPSEHTCAHPPTAKHCTGPPPSSRRVSTSSHLASMSVAGVSGKRDIENGEGEVGDAALPAEDDAPLLPGACQFLTPKRDAKPWWEAEEGQNQSTGRRRKGRGRERETRGSAGSWILMD